MPIPRVTVYCFNGYNIIADKTIPSKYMASLETIKKLNCAPLMETAKEVDTSELDDNGFYPKK
jgi:hypothetical protein